MQPGNPELIALPGFHKHGVRDDEDGESCTCYATFERAAWPETDEAAEAALKDAMYGAGCEVYGRRIDSPYDCTGRWFASEGRVHFGKRFMVFVQGWGRDV
jgi:hypothetical protein